MSVSEHNEATYCQKRWPKTSLKKGWDEVARKNEVKEKQKSIFQTVNRITEGRVQFWGGFFSSIISTQEKEEVEVKLGRPSHLSEDGCLLSSRHPDGLLGNGGRRRRCVTSWTGRALLPWAVSRLAHQKCALRDTGLKGYRRHTATFINELYMTPRATAEHEQHRWRLVFFAPQHRWRCCDGDEDSETDAGFYSPTRDPFTDFRGSSILSRQLSFSMSPTLHIDAVLFMTTTK